MKRSQDTKRPHTDPAGSEKDGSIARPARRLPSIPGTVGMLARYLPLAGLALFLIFAMLASFLPSSAASLAAAHPVEAPRIVWRDSALTAAGRHDGDEVDFVRSFGRAPFPADHDESAASDPAAEARLALPRW